MVPPLPDSALLFRDTFLNHLSMFLDPLSAQGHRLAQCVTNLLLESLGESLPLEQPLQHRDVARVTMFICGADDKTGTA